MINLIIFFVLIIISIISFIVAGRTGNKSITVWDILFILAFWNLFDTGWWFHFDWSQQAEPDMLNTAYMISAIPFTVIFLIFAKKREINMGDMFHTQVLVFPKPPCSIKEITILVVFTGTAVFIVLPVAFLMGFISWAPDLRYARMPLRFIEYFLLVGFVEELVFRGVIQNLLTGTFNFKYGRTAAFLLANIFFAFMWTHSGVPDPVNWEYIAMAFLMGLFYGGVYLKSGNLWTAAFLHGLTDFLWITFFAGQG